VVLAATETITHHTAATAATAIHMHYEGEVVQTQLDAFTGVLGLDGIAVLAPQQGLVEFFPSDEQMLHGLGPVAAVVAASGWNVAVLVESRRMGEAHRALRGFPLQLQAWWDAGDRICFGGPEVA
jgi:hypothetical protein